MSLPTGDVIGMLADNLRLRGSVVPIPARRSSRWARTLGLPRGGSTVLYTGQTYQLMPYLEGLSAAQHRLDGSKLSRLSGLGRRINKLVNVTTFMAFPSGSERDRYDRILIDIATVLRGAGVEFGALYGDDLYTGTLVHDFGQEEVVRAHARRVQKVLRRHGVREVITVDPHTTHMLRTVFPELLGDFDVRVRSYLEVLAERAPTPRRELADVLAVHDSCVYARYEDVVDQPRNLLRSAGVAVRNPDRAGILTWCCGGPAESLYPEKAAAVAQNRVGQLREVAPSAVTMCPICLVNLRKAAGDSLQLQDISHYLRRAYGD